MRIQVPNYIEECDGELYAGDTGVTVYTIIVMRNVHHQTLEEIQKDFPSVPLATIDGVIAYYLDHQQELDERFAKDEAYFQQMRQAQRDDPNSMATVVRRRIEAARQQDTGTA